MSLPKSSGSAANSIAEGGWGSDRMGPPSGDAAAAITQGKSSGLGSEDILLTLQECVLGGRQPRPLTFPGTKCATSRSEGGRALQAEPQVLPVSPLHRNLKPVFQTTKRRPSPG